MIHNFINDIKIMPLKIVVIKNIMNGDEIRIAHLEEESRINIVPINTEHMIRGSLNVGYDFSAHIVIPHNDFANNDLIDIITSIKEEHTAESKHICFMYFGNVTTNTNNLIPQINATGSLGIVIRDFSISLSIDTVPGRPRAYININTLISKDSLKSIIMKGIYG